MSTPASLARHLRLPAKALLWGEYGALIGFPAICLTFPTPMLELRIVLEPCPPGRAPSGSVRVISSFFASGWIEIPIAEIPSLLLSEASRDQHFFAAMIAPYTGELAKCDLTVAVLQAFDPSFGLGTSSALLAGIHHTLFHFFLAHQHETPLESAEFWRRADSSLRLLQGGGSGYDVAVQLAGMNSTSCQLWRFQAMSADDVRPPNVLPLPLSWAGHGCLLRTETYSDTAHWVRRFMAQGASSHGLARRHGALAERFLLGQSPECIPELMAESRQIAYEQGILARSSTPIGQLLELLERLDLPFKSMGAGHGDCLWLNRSRLELAALDLVHPVSGQPLLESVVLEF